MIEIVLELEFFPRESIKSQRFSGENIQLLFVREKTDWSF